MAVPDVPSWLRVPPRTGGPSGFRPSRRTGRNPKREKAGNVLSRAVFAIRVTQDRSGVKSKEGDIESSVMN